MVTSQYLFLSVLLLFIFFFAWLALCPNSIWTFYHVKIMYSTAFGARVFNLLILPALLNLCLLLI